MKIIQVMPNPPHHRGGVEELVINLSRALTEKQHLVTVFCMDDSLTSTYKEEVMEEILIKKFKPLVGNPLCIPPHKLLTDLLNEEGDIIHVHNIHVLLPAFIARIRRHPSGKVVLQPHYHRYGQNVIRNFLFSVYKKTVLPTILQQFNVIIANSKYEARCLVEDFPRIASKITLIPEKCSVKVPSSIRWKSSLQPRKVLYVGSLRRYKNVDTLLYAFKILNTKWKNLRLVIIGEGQEKKRLLNLAFKLKIQDQITWKRRLSYNELLQEYSEASAVIQLSELESFSRVAHEAIAVGTPLVVYNHGVFRELVEKGLAKGVDKLSAVEVADAISSVLNDWKVETRRRGFGSASYVVLIVRVYKAVIGDFY